MNQLIFERSAYDQMSIELLASNEETCAVILLRTIRTTDSNFRFMVFEVQHPRPHDYISRSSSFAQLSPTFVANVTKKARSLGASLAFVHTHVGACEPVFSGVDDRGESVLCQFLERRMPGQPHAALLVTKQGLAARLLGTTESVEVVSLGERRIVLTDPSGGSEDMAAASTRGRYDRQIRAFGSVGQALLGRISVGIVGLGGTGSMVAEQLAHLGVRNFVLIDPDTVEETNLNRLVGAGQDDLGADKVSVAARQIRRHAPDALVEEIKADVIYSRTALRLRSCDFIFGCTDSHGSRAVIQQVAYQYFVPCIDMGSTIVKRGEVEFFGRVQMLSPGLGCFTCAGLLDPNEVRRDMMSAFERKMDPYVAGEREPAPSVVSINGTVASLSLTMFLAAVCGIPSSARHLIYNGKQSTLRSARIAPLANCFICSSSGVLGKGDSQALFARQD